MAARRARPAVAGRRRGAVAPDSGKVVPPDTAVRTDVAHLGAPQQRRGSPRRSRAAPRRRCRTAARSAAANAAPPRRVSSGTSDARGPALCDCAWTSGATFFRTRRGRGAGRSG